MSEQLSGQYKPFPCTANKKWNDATNIYYGKNYVRNRIFENFGYFLLIYDEGVLQNITVYHCELCYSSSNINKYRNNHNHAFVARGYFARLLI